MFVYNFHKQKQLRKRQRVERLRARAQDRATADGRRRHEGMLRAVYGKSSSEMQQSYMERVGMWCSGQESIEAQSGLDATGGGATASPGAAAASAAGAAGRAAAGGSAAAGATAGAAAAAAAAAAATGRSPGGRGPATPGPRRTWYGGATSVATESRRPETAPSHHFPVFRHRHRHKERAHSFFFTREEPPRRFCYGGGRMDRARTAAIQRKRAARLSSTTEARRVFQTRDRYDAAGYETGLNEVPLRDRDRGRELHADHGSTLRPCMPLLSSFIYSFVIAVRSTNPYFVCVC